MQIRKQSQCEYRCQYHIVRITQYRYKVLEEEKRYVKYQEKEDLGQAELAF
jgi:REP element-mobilizing transposase RayT